jgi:DNA-directed RNA polymerase subunit RPC12/RpoP
MDHNRSLPVVDEPHPRKGHVVEAPEDGPVWEGTGDGAHGDVSYVCGDCGRVLVSSVTERTTISRVHIECTCGALNDARVDPLDGAFDEDG